MFAAVHESGYGPKRTLYALTDLRSKLDSATIKTPLSAATMPRPEPRRRR
jgi:hypothetical protein